MFCKKGVLRNFVKSQENTCARVSLLKKLQARGLLKKRLWHRCVPVNFAESLRTTFIQSTSGRLLLHRDISSLPGKLLDFRNFFKQLLESRAFIKSNDWFLHEIQYFIKKDYTNSHWRCSIKKSALKNFANLTGNKIRLRFLSKMISFL